MYAYSCSSSPLKALEVFNISQSEGVYSVYQRDPLASCFYRPRTHVANIQCHRIGTHSRQGSILAACAPAADGGEGVMQYNLPAKLLVSLRIALVDSAHCL
jgi:hypothetical protein